MGRRGLRVARYSAITAVCGAVIALLGVWLIPLGLSVALALPLGLVAGAPFGMLIAASIDDGETADRKLHVPQGNAAVSEEGEDRVASRRRDDNSESAPRVPDGL